MKRKRLLIITNRFYPQVGGAERNIFLLSQELGRHYDVDIFTPIRDNDNPTEKIGPVTIFRFYNLFNLSNKFPYIKAKTLCLGMFFKILFHRYDIIHCFPAINYNNLLAIIAARLTFTPIFMTVFDLFDYADILKKNSYTALKDLHLNSREKFWLKQFSYIFTISNRETNMIKAVNPNVELSIVPVDLSEFETVSKGEILLCRDHYKISRNKKIILLLGRVSHIKGQDILLECLKSIRQKHQDFIVLIVGSIQHEPDYYQKLKSYIDDENLSDFVQFTGAIPRENISALLHACEMHILPVRFMNSGAVVIETWASSKPIIQSRYVDPNFVIEGVNGFTFEDQNDLTQKILYLLEHPDEAKKMGEQGHAFVKDRFLYSKLVAQYRRVYY